MKTLNNINPKTVLVLIFFFCITLQSSSLYAQITSIPDPNFEQALIDLGIDSDGTINGQVLTSDIDSVETLDVRYRSISNLTGIEDFAALEDLDVRGNNLTIIDTSNNTQLITLICSVNPSNSINISNNLLLETLNIGGLHQLDNIDLSNNVNLETLEMVDCWIDTIDISNNINLKTFIAGGVSFSEIDLSNNELLEYLDLTGVHLNSLDVSNNLLLKEFYCGNYGGDIGQEIASIDISNNSNLEIFYAENLFFLETLNAKNGNNAILNVTLPCEFEGNPCELTELHCVMVDDEDAATNNEPPYSSWLITADYIYSEDCSLGVSTQKEQGFSIYPNPTQNELYIKSQKSKTGNLKIKIFNVEGKLLSLQNLNFENQASLNISHLSSGIYFLNIESENGMVEVKKFIKQ